MTAGRLTGAVSRRLGRGGGTALPGVIAQKLDPALVANLASGLGRGSVMVTGTNGKTTATRVLASILAEAGMPTLHNREGSNMMRGLASAFLGASGMTGSVRHGRERLGLFEVDEATLPDAARALQPRAIAFTNLFRDQLDRYGEVDTVAALWREALALTPRDATLVLNADDPSVADLALEWNGPVHWFGVDDASFATDFPGATDARWCRACGGTFAYELRYFAHVGLWRCTGCGRERAAPATSALQIRLELDSACFDVPGLGELSMPLTGLYNVYNALAAIATARVLGIEGGAIVRGLANVRAAFGRQEVALLEGRRLRLLLVKNPAGANQVLRLLAAVAPAGGIRVAALLNDRHADGQDVSWTWDVDFELLRGRIQSLWASGDRAEDMALRLKYAGWPRPLSVVRHPADLLEAILRDTGVGDDVFVIPTYTAMLDLRGELAHRGAVERFWQESSL